MRRGGSPVKAWFVFAIKWQAIWFLLALLCCTLFLSGHGLLGLLAILVFAFFFVRACGELGRRLRSVRQAYDPSKAVPEWRMRTRKPRP